MALITFDVSNISTQSHLHHINLCIYISAIVASTNDLAIKTSLLIDGKLIRKWLCQNSESTRSKLSIYTAVTGDTSRQIAMSVMKKMSHFNYSYILCVCIVFYAGKS